MLIQLAKICIYIALASPLIASKSLFFPFIIGKVIFFRVFTELGLLCTISALAYGTLPLENIKKIVKKPIFLAISVFTALFILSGITAQNPSFAFWSNFERGEGIWQIIHYLILFFIILVLFRSKKDWINLISIQSIIGAFIALYALGQYIHWPAWIINPPTGVGKSGTLGNPSYMGIYMAITAYFTFWIALQNQGNKKLFWLFIAFFQILFFLTAQNRGSFAGVGIGIVLMLFLWLFQKKRRKKIYYAVILLSFLIVTGVSALILTVRGGEALQSIQPRFWTWESAIAGIIERPLTGWGAENFPFVFDAYYNPKHYQLESWFDRAHSIPLEYLTIGGIPLFLAYIGIFAVLYIRLIKRKDDRLWPFFMAIPLTYFISGLVLFEVLPLYLIFFILLGLIDTYADDFQWTVSPRTTKNTTGAGMQILLTILAIGIGISLYATAYLPFQKNKMILKTMRTNGKTDIEIFKEHEAALLYPSPVGNQEALQNLLTFTVSYFDYLQKNNIKEKIAKINTIMKFNAHWYEKLKDSAIGVKTIYIRITGLIAAYQITKDAAYLKEADGLIAKGTLRAPTRIEFVRLTMISAALYNDPVAYAQALQKGKKLLPTLAWEPDMTKFKSNLP